jgi:hypothetical protein
MSVRSVDKADIQAAAAELKKNWRNVERELSRVAAKNGVAAKRVVTKAKKAVKKATAKKPAKKARKKKA